MNFKTIMELIGRWGGTMKFFPSDPDARIGIAEELIEIASDAEQIRWLVLEAPKLWSAWPGMLEIRALFCSRFQPRDGVEAISAVVDDHTERLSAPERPQITGTAGPPIDSDPAFPCDVLSLMAEATLKRFPVLDPKTRSASAEEIAHLLAIQNANRKESKPVLKNVPFGLSFWGAS